MIEVELKYKIKEKPNIHLKQIKEKNGIDVYYDTKDYQLISKGNFLRVRDNQRIDFKLSTNDLSHTYCKEVNFNINNFSENIKNFNEIVTSINLTKISLSQTFSDFLSLNQLETLAKISKKRTQYILNENIIISLDEVDELGLFLEAEVNVDENEDINNIKEYIISALEQNNLLPPSATPVNVGYVELYLYKHNKQAYNKGLYQNI